MSKVFSSRQKITIIVIIYSELEVLNYNMSCFKNEAKLFITINLITTNLEQDLLQSQTWQDMQHNANNNYFVLIKKALIPETVRASNP